jgi:hypothetical protein
LILIGSIGSLDGHSSHDSHHVMGQFGVGRRTKEPPEQLSLGRKTKSTFRLKKARKMSTVTSKMRVANAWTITDGLFTLEPPIIERAPTKQPPTSSL